ncbi:MAG: arginase family protein [Thermoanaerobaculia bacterium]
MNPRAGIARADRRVVVIEAPSNLGLKPPKPGKQPGVRRLPEALEKAGLSKRLQAERFARVEPPPYSETVDPETGIRNAPAIARYSLALAESLGRALDRDAFPLVLGGDCSILLGSLLALRRRGRYGLFFVDGHADFATPETSASRGAAGMDLTLATGRGPKPLANLAGLSPLVLDEDVAILGYRDGERLPGSIAACDVARLRLAGIAQTARRQEAALRRRGVRGFWIHVDADVLDPSIMPAVDTPEPGGLTFAELTDLLRELFRSDLAAGLQICIYDPDLDPEGRCAQGLVDAIAASFEVRTSGRRGRPK